MSLSFYGWEVVCDKVLTPSQAPRDDGVYRMYHGTTVASAGQIIGNGFQPSIKGILGAGVYVTRDIQKAERYPLSSHPTDRVVLELLVHVGRVKRIDKAQHPLQYTWNQNKYDTAWVPPNCSMVPSGMTEDCVYDPKRIEVTGIAKSPSPVIKQQLKTLIENTPQRPWKGSTAQSGDMDGGSVCALCNRNMKPGHAHTAQKCWSCDKDICIFMDKHVCPANSEGQAANGYM